MKMHSRWSCILVAGLTMVASAADTPVLTWSDCVRMAALHNPAIQSAVLATLASRAQYRGSWNGILPRITLSNSYSDSNSSQSGVLLENGTTGTVSTDAKSWQLQGNASLDLFDLGQWASIESAAATFRQNQANQDETSAQTLLALYQAFANLLYSESEAQVATDIYHVWDVDAGMIRLRYDSGTESKGNRMQIEAQLLESQSDLSQAARDVKVAQSELGQAIGTDDFETLVVTGTWAATAAPPEPNIEQLLAHHPQYRAQEAVIEQAEDAVKLANSTLWPTLSLSYNKGWNGVYEFPNNSFSTFSGVASYPLFGGGLTSTYYASQSAHRLLDKAKEDLRALRYQLVSSLESAWSAYAQAEELVTVQKAFFDSAQQRKLEYDALYKSGLVSYQDWQQVVVDYVNYEKSYLRAEQTLILDEAQWRFAKGETLGESL